MTEERREETIISLGAGVQSSAMLLMSVLGENGVPPASHAIFADTGDEPRAVYDYLGVLNDWVQAHGAKIEIHAVQAVADQSLSMQILDTIEGRAPTARFPSVPLYTKDLETGKQGMLRRQCTKDWKLIPIRRKAREILGIEKGKRANPKKVFLRQLIGISVDEAQRMKPSGLQWIQNEYPLVDANISRAACREYLLRHGLPEPPKSACFHCPFRSNFGWVALREIDPEAFAAAVDFDARVRRMGGWGDLKKGDGAPRGAVRAEVYVHRRMVPLDQAVEEDARQSGLQFTDDDRHFANECTGMCGV